MNHGPNITCPKCGAEIPLSEAVSHRLREEISNEFEKQRREQDAAMAEREKKLVGERTKLEESRHALQQEVSRQVDAEKQKLLADARRRAEEKVQVELRDLRAQLAEQQTKLTQGQATELELRARQRKLEEARDAMELEMARKLDGERAKIAETARLQGAEAERLKLADREQVIKGLQEQIEALKQRAEQGSMQLQGETLEIELENDLRRAFPFDEITEVKKGQRGADVMQRVRTNAGLDCGAILWEAKRARNWTADWPAKLKEDQREAKSELAVLVVTSLPPGVRSMAQIDGIWVCEPALAPIVAAALRQGLVAVAMQRLQDTGRADKMARLYEYLCSVEFRQHIEGIVESFTGLQEQLATEQRAFARQWKEREQQITKAIQHTAMLYGSIQGVTGRDALPAIDCLGLQLLSLPVEHNACSPSLTP